MYTYNAVSVERLKFPVLNTVIDLRQMPKVKKLEIGIFTGVFDSPCDYAIANHVIHINEIPCVSKNCAV